MKLQLQPSLIYRYYAGFIHVSLACVVCLSAAPALVVGCVLLLLLASAGYQWYSLRKCADSCIDIDKDGALTLDDKAGVRRFQLTSATVYADRLVVLDLRGERFWQRQSIMLFSDCMPGESFRRLRVFVTLVAKA